MITAGWCQILAKTPRNMPQIMTNLTVLRYKDALLKLIKE